MSRKRMLVTGHRGQVVTSLIERNAYAARFDIVTVGRPQFDLRVPESIGPAIERMAPDIIVSAAAFTAVDRAESEEELAMQVNGLAPGEIGRTAARLSVPLIHLSTDYVFDGSSAAPYTEDCPVAPLSVYGRSKLAGERGVAAAGADHVVLRTAWIYGPHGENFAKTMLRLARMKSEIPVVDDQIGNPTSSLDLADAIIAVAEHLLADRSTDLRGIFHVAASGEASWADFASDVFSRAAACGGPSTRVRAIPSADFPALARRPANSRLNCELIKRIHGVALPDWRSSMARDVSRLVEQDREVGRRREA